MMVRLDYYRAAKGSLRSRVGPLSGGEGTDTGWIAATRIPDDGLCDF